MGPGLLLGVMGQVSFAEFLPLTVICEIAVTCYNAF